MKSKGGATLSNPAVLTLAEADADLQRLAVLTLGIPALPKPSYRERVTRGRRQKELQLSWF